VQVVEKRGKRIGKMWNIRKGERENTWKKRK